MNIERIAYRNGEIWRYFVTELEGRNNEVVCLHVTDTSPGPSIAPAIGGMALPRVWEPEYLRACARIYLWVADDLETLQKQKEAR